MKLISIISLFIFLGCGGESSNYNDSFSTEEASAVYDELEKTVVSSNQVRSADNASEEIEQKIIKTARLTFQTENLEETHQKIIQLVKTHRGIVQQDNATKGYNRLTKYLTIRIPTGSFQEFIEGVSDGVGYFDQRDISRKDVTEEFVDLEARLKAKRELEKRYLELLGQAKNVKEVLEIERELSQIREEIEAKQGRLEYLKNRVAMSTVAIEFYTLTAETGVTQSYGQKMINALKGGWDGISMFFIGLLYIWPVFLIAIVLFLVIRWLIKRKKK